MELRPSPRLAAAIVAAWVAAGTSAWLALPGPSGWAIAVLGLTLGCATARDRGLLRGRRAPRVIELHDAGEASIERADGARIAVRPGGRRVGRLWVILRLQSFSRRHLLVAADMLDAEAFRRLRLWALWGRWPSGAPAQPQG